MKNIAIIPFWDKYLNNKIFSWDIEEFLPFILLKKEFTKKWFIFNTIDLFDDLNHLNIIISFNIPYCRKYNKIIKNFKWKKILIIFEPPVTNPTQYNKNKHKYFNYIFTWNKNLIKNKKYIHLNHYQYNFKNQLKSPIEFNKKKKIVLINANKISFEKNELYTWRIKIIDFLSKRIPKEFDLYWYNWNKPLSIFYLKSAFKKNKIFKFLRYFVNSFTPPITYKWTVNNKINTLWKYKFVICYENMFNINWYITEKIWDCLKAKTVAIYLWAENINEIIPKNCFIDRRIFKTNNELLNFINNIKEKEYNKYIENINKFLSKEETKKYFDENWANNLSCKIFKLIK